MAAKKWDDDFDPHEERKTEHGLTHFEGVTNVIKGCLGTGLLALPEVFSFSGTYNGMVLFIVISVFGIYCFHLNLKAQYILCKIKKVGFMSYGASLQAAFEVGPNCLAKIATCAGPFVDSIQIVYQFGCLCVYIIFMGVNLKMVCDQYFEPQHVLIYIVYTFPPALAISLVPNIKMFSPVSTFANVVLFITVGVIAYYVSQGLKDWNSLPYIGDWQDFPLFFGTVLFSLLSVPSILSVENNMDDPAYFVAPFGALNIGFVIVSILYVTIGIMGYWRYGDAIQSSITLNFPETAILAQVIRSLYVVAIWVTYGFNAIVPRDILWNGYIITRLSEGSSAKKRWTIDYVIRFIIVIVSYAVAMLVPLLGSVISLTGGLGLSLIGIMFPAVMHICALWPDNFGKFKWILWKDILIFIIGTFGMVSSMYASVRDIITDLGDENN